VLSIGVIYVFRGLYKLKRQKQIIKILIPNTFIKSKNNARIIAISLVNKYRSTKKFLCFLVVWMLLSKRSVYSFRECYEENQRGLTKILTILKIYLTKREKQLNERAPLLNDPLDKL
jgi:hypothetical protein